MKITGCGENRLFRTPFFEHALVSKTLLFFGSGISPYGEKKGGEKLAGLASTYFPPQPSGVSPWGGSGL
jgi:hypothetical protein